jgi:uncharacterized protein YkwD
MPHTRAAVPLLATLLVALPWTAGAVPADADGLRRTFFDLINAERERQGLQALALDPALVRAAQAHADDMTARQYVGFSSPAGRQIEDWTREAGYVFQLVTEKLATTPEPPEAIARDWARWPESNRKSLFHPDVRDVGVGIGEVRGTPVYTFVLARSEKSYLERYVAELYERQTLALQNVEALREELLRQVNEARAGAKLHPLTRHPALDRAAQEHAEALLSAIRSGSPLRTAGPLTARVKLQKYRIAGTPGTVGELIVTEALSPQQALAELLDEGRGQRSTLFGRGFTQMGIGVSFERTPEGFRVVWVQCLARPAAMPTTSDAREPGSPQP